MRAVDGPAHKPGGGAPRPRRWGWLVLATSSATLVCCVFPIVLVSLGFGAAVAATFGALPFLTILGVHKEWTFALSALVLLAGAWALYRPGRACPADADLARACKDADRWNRRLLTVALAIWGVSFFTAYLLTPLAFRLGFF